jgi:flagellar P-ring protein precursor FlgI
MLAIAAALAGPTAQAEVRVESITRLQGQRTNALMGYGLVVGLNGTGDGGKSLHTMQALMKLHQRFHQPVINVDHLKNSNNVALVIVEVTIPEYGASEGDKLDVFISAPSAKSLKGGQLLTTPLQFAMFDAKDPATQAILALAGGPVVLTDSETPTRGVVRNGATLEEHFFYNFIENGYITLVLHNEQAGYPMARAVARAINRDVSTSVDSTVAGDGERGVTVVADEQIAVALSPKHVRVRIPPEELARPARFITEVLETELFMQPRMPARVIINRNTKHVALTGTVTIAPTVLQIPGVGTVAVGGDLGASPGSAPGAPAGQPESVEFQKLLDALGRLQLSRDQLIAVIEQLRDAGTLHAKVIYTE